MEVQVAEAEHDGLHLGLQSAEERVASSITGGARGVVFRV